jgi:hypothetical protein
MSKSITVDNYNINASYGSIKYSKENGMKYTIPYIAIDIESIGDHIAINVSPDTSPKSSPKTSPKTIDNSIINSIFSKLTNYFS